MRRLALLVVLGLAILVLGVGQLVLPGVAASVLRSRLAHSGRVVSVRVSAFPAIELLWHDADRVVVRMSSYRSGTGRLASLLDQTAGVSSLDADVTTLRAGLLTLHDVRLTKRGDQLAGRATLLDSDLRAAIPFLDSVSFVSATGGALTLSGTGSVLGVTATVPVTVRPQVGRLVAAPDVPFGGLATLTVFSDPHLIVEEVGGSPIGGGVSVSGRARLR